MKVRTGRIRPKEFLCEDTNEKENGCEDRL